jgi:hypothetical protein
MMSNPPATHTLQDFRKRHDLPAWRHTLKDFQGPLISYILAYRFKDRFRPVEQCLRIQAHRCKRRRNRGWRDLPRPAMYGEYGLVNLIRLIPSLASRTYAPS